VDAVVVVDVAEDGLVGELPHPNASAAPAALPTTPSASRRVINLEPFMSLASAIDCDVANVTELWQRHGEIVT
jgi:hypothetical protein